MEDCIFCKIIDKKANANVVYEDDKMIVFPDIHPKADLHLLVVPKRHIISLLETTEADLSLISHVITQLPRLAKQFDVKGFRTIINTGKEGGQQVPHLHIHLLSGNLSNM